MNSNLETLRRRMSEIVDEHGEWTAMSIRLAEGVHTLEPPTADHRLRRFTQLISDLTRKPLAELRVLDLACLEGHYGIELALHGAEVVGIEAREANLAKARFAAEVLGLDRVSLIRDDVRNLDPARHGFFDAVICSGILYHLDAPDVFHFVERISEACKGVAIFDTEIALRSPISVEYRGKVYHGLYYQEHRPEDSEADRMTDLWSSIDNVQSFWFTRPSLMNLLFETHFTSVLECHIPNHPDHPLDRRTFVAIKGEKVQVLSSPATDSLEHRPLSETPSPNMMEVNRGGIRQVSGRLRSMIPSGLKRTVKRAVHSIRGIETGRTVSSQPWTWREPWKRR